MRSALRQTQKLDSLDLSLLEILLEDSRQSYTQLAEKTGVHKDTVRRRVQRLIDLEIIGRFTININQDNLSEMYPALLRVIYAISINSQPDSIVKELINHKNVIQVDEATPSAAHSILVNTEFKNMRDFREFTNWLKANDNIDASNLVVIPIYKQHKRRKRIVSVIK